MIRTPAQHQTDPAKAAGSVKNDITLGDYIARKTANDPKKMTFEDWKKKKGFPVTSTQEPLWRECWETAQRNV